MDYIFGLLGKNLAHSFSKSYFTEKFSMFFPKGKYINFELQQIENLNEVISNYPYLVGLNVTIPYKELILRYLHQVNEPARTIGSVNTITYHQQKLIGDNTDIIGFAISLRQFLPSGFKSKALILGTGGAAKAVHYSLTQHFKFECLFVSRKESDHRTISYEEINTTVLDQYRLIINTTPCGMYPNINECPPFPTSLFTPQHYVYDLIYNPSLTRFLRLAKSNNASIQNGLNMLYLQADASWNIWRKNLNL